LLPWTRLAKPFGLAADRTPAVQEAARRQGAVYMRKPVKPAALRAAMSQLRTRAQAAQ
jgi:hypothetical protein